MKALEILKKIYANKPDTRFQRNNIDINFTIHDFYKINKAIKELEALENRCCEGCKYYKEQNKTYCNGFEQDEECLRFVDDIHKIPCKDFSCNKWESK